MTRNPGLALAAAWLIQASIPSIATAQQPPVKAPAAPIIPGLPPGLDLPVDVNEIVKKAIEEANSANPAPAKKPAPPKGKQGAKQATEESPIPGLPALPPGVELPEDVKAFLKKGFSDAAKTKTPPPKNTPPAANKNAPAKTAVAKTSNSTRPRAAAATTFKRVAIEKSLGPIGDLDLDKFSPSKPHFWISPDGRRFAYLIDKGIVIDGKEYKYQTDVKEKTVSFSPDSKRVAYVVNLDRGETLVLNGQPEPKGWNFIANHDGAVFSPDSQHVAYTARRYVGGGVEYVLMIDGLEREVFKESPAWAMSFTPDGKRVVWGEHVGERTLMRETSVDGSQPRIERTHGPSLMTINFFFGGSGQYGYVAHDADGKHFIFYDGKEATPRFKNEIKRRDILLSEDGKHLAYVAEPESFRRVVVMDGKPSKAYGGLDADYVKDSLALSPDGRRWGYAIKHRNQQFAVIDGKQGKAYRSVGGLAFSADGQHVAYQAQLTNKLHVVLDGREGPGYDELGIPVFSPDGKSVAVAAGAGPRKFVVLNGQPQPAYADVTTPAFAPAGNRLVYRAEIESGGQWLLHDGGREGKPYDIIEPDLFFSEGGQHLATVVLEGNRQMVIVDGVEGNSYDSVLTLGGGHVHFDAPDRFHYLAAKGKELFLVEESIQP